jgi:hypothetical protein
LGAAGRQTITSVVVAQDAEPYLLEIVLAVGSPGRLAGRLHRWQEKADESADDRNDDQELYKGEATPVAKVVFRLSRWRNHGKHPFLDAD